MTMTTFNSNADAFQQLYSIDPGWHSCLDGISAFYDPPRVLKPGMGLTAVAATATSDPPVPADQPPTGRAENGATAAPQTPAPTSTPSDPKKTNLETPISPNQATNVQDGPVPGFPTKDLSNAQSPDDQTVDPPSSPQDPATPAAIYWQSNAITEGAPSITQDGQAIAYKSGTLYIGASAVPVPSVNKQDATTFVAAGLTFSARPSGTQDGTPPTLTIGNNIFTANTASQYLVGGQTLMAGSPAITISGTVISLGAGNPELVIGTSTEGPALGSLIMQGFEGPPQLSQVITQGLTFSEDASEAIISGTTYPLESDASKTIMIGSQTLVLGPAGTIRPSSPSPLTIDGVTFAADASQAIIGGKTYPINTNSPSSTVEYNGRTLYLGPNGIQVAPTLSAITEGSLTLSLDATEAVIKGTTYPIGQGATPTTIVVDDETLSLGPNGVGIPSFTIAPPDIKSTMSALTMDGLTISLDATEAVIQGTTYPIGLGATSTTIVVGTKTLSLGPGGVGLPPTDIPPLTPIGTLSSLTVDGVTLSLDSTEAVIEGTTYPIGPGASATVVVVGNETLSLGPGGVGFPSTTIAPPDGTSDNVQAFTGAGGLSKQVLGRIDISVLVIITLLF